PGAGASAALQATSRCATAVSYAGLPCKRATAAQITHKDYGHVSAPTRSHGLDFRRQKSYKRRIHHIACGFGRWPLSGPCLRAIGWHAIGLMERDVADVEFPKRPSMLDDILRRSLTDNYRSVRDGAEPVRHDASDGGAGNGLDMNNHYEAAMNSGTNVNLRRLQEQLDRQPLD